MRSPISAQPTAATMFRAAFFGLCAAMAAALGILIGGAVAGEFAFPDPYRPRKDPYFSEGDQQRGFQRRGFCP